MGAHPRRSDLVQRCIGARSFARLETPAIDGPARRTSARLQCVLPRIWIALLAVLLLAASAGSTVEVVDDQSSTSLCDDEATMHVQVLSAESAPGRTVCAASRADAALPAPELARVFRPPRPSFD